ncbi:ArsR/SmtB family transcription factor [Actinoplanes sp. G11-F43]|uniref:ArsR/SmtB family transcription factor n=1 Tax=Actinoplanes sp. G11-F43 TaxID=3424130 RepID=UPI003D337E68
MSNPLGDVEITDPQTMRALAHPVRLAILDVLRRNGPATATQLAPDVGATPTVTSWHLRHLAGFGLVRDAEPGPDRRQRRWEAVGRGFRFSSPEDGDEATTSAARSLTQEMFQRYAGLPVQWITDVEPGLTPEWRRLSVNYGIRPLGALLGGLLGTAAGIRPSLLVAAAGGVLSVLWLLPSPIPRIRTLEAV